LLALAFLNITSTDIAINTTSNTITTISIIDTTLTIVTVIGALSLRRHSVCRHWLL
jgi:hypothetical protein